MHAAKPTWPYWALALLPPVFLVVCLARWFVHVPYLDQWWLLPLVVAQREGTLVFAEIWHQNAEHRLFFPKIIMLFLARCSDWDLRWEIGANLFFSLSAFGVVLLQLRRTEKLTRSHTQPIFYPLISFVLFSLAPFENWLWSWQMPYFLIQFCLVVLAYGLGMNQKRVLSWGLAITSATVASLSFATGVAVWFSGAGVILLTAPKRRVWRFLLLWMLWGSIVVALYSVGYQFLRWNDPVAAITRVTHLIGYVFVYLGAALVPTHWINAAGVLGASYLILFFTLWAIALRSPVRRRLAMAPYLGWMTFAIGAALLTAAGRSNVHEIVQAMTPRYITFTQLGWLGGVLALNVGRKTIPTNRSLRSKAIVLAQLAISVGFAVAYANGLQGMKWLSGEIRQGRDALITTQELRAIRKLYVVPEQLRDEFLPLMTKYRLGPFARETRH
ncbi:MAG: hypothetical protein ACP5QZ_11720 [Candidatus Sumerlaeaceae bacterium]